MRGAGFLAIWSDIESKALTDYRHWLTREHTTERVTTKGFLASRVFRRNEIFFVLVYAMFAEIVIACSALRRRLLTPKSVSLLVCSVSMSISLFRTPST